MHIVAAGSRFDPATTCIPGLHAGSIARILAGRLDAGNQLVPEDFRGGYFLHVVTSRRLTEWAGFTRRKGRWRRLEPAPRSPCRLIRAGLFPVFWMYRFIDKGPGPS